MALHLAVLGAGAVVSGLLLAAFILAVAYSNLPPIDSIADYKPKIPLRVWTADGQLIGEFGEERRDYIKIGEVAPVVKQAILAAEDDRFYEHRGVDYAGLARAVLANFATGRRGQGGSTITMQIARTFYLPTEKLYTRKIYEIALAFKIEAELSKDRILEIYVNQIFLGHRAYGFGAAAQTYFGKRLNDLSAGQVAILAGIPVAPSAYNPRTNPKRAKARQTYVLGRMLQLGYIDKTTHDKAVAEPIVVRGGPAPLVADDTNSSARPRLHAEFAAELARQLMFEIFREETYSRGINVYTTLVSSDQQAAYEALRAQVLDYDRRYGYRGPEAFVQLLGDPVGREQQIEDALIEAIDSPGLLPAVVLEASPKAVKVVLAGGEVATVSGEGLRFAARALDPKAQPTRRIVPGALVRVTPLRASRSPALEIVQLPQVEAAFVAADAGDGAVRALVGGFDFNLNKFNHVTQAWRQPGSSFKPFIYSAALEKGFMPSTLINDAPLAVDPALTGGQLWEPKNYDGKFEGPMRLRQGLAKSKNLVSIRVLQSITPRFAQEHIQRFGFPAERHPPYLTMALGAGSVTPWQMLAGYGVIASGGYRVQPYLIARVTDAQGRSLMEAQPVVAGDESQRVLSARNAFLMDSLLRDVTRFGTAVRAQSLKRSDLAGKTGTTNDSHDAWFAGYGGGLVAVGWMGFDQPRPLGERETGGGLALPIWINYMAAALKNREEVAPAMPEGVVALNGELYYAEFPPGAAVASLGLEDGLAPEEQKKTDKVRDQIF
ncbi:MAG: PBP1A family penicillin-binding protein [Burkholderiales bacterium]|jgi:penicillin-binding protein 1A|nr:PBP1A family penicillin-binding protein [Burkholderiales bacterium]MCA3230581.1 PBP1A family penicillin-binding protein [Burkholderiales bacterium]